MTWLDALRSAGGSLAQHKLRSALTALGIMIGVAAVVAIISIGGGISAYVETDIERLMSNGVVITPEPLAALGAGARSRGRLTDGDGAAIADQVVDVRQVSGTLNTSAVIVAGDRNTTAHVEGVDLGYFDIRKFRLAGGRNWTEVEQSVGARVCILGARTAHDLFLDDDPIGREVRLGNFSYEVLGVSAARGASLVLADQDNRVFLPLASFRRRVASASGDRVDTLLVSARSRGALPNAQTRIDELLRQRHRIEPEALADYRIRTQEEFRRKQEKVTSTLSALLLVVAGVSLLVAGIGVLNVMLVSVVERTREIGLRIALGASPAEIGAQFLAEPLLLCLGGGLPGCFVGILLTAAFGKLAHVPVSTSYPSVALATATSLLVGLTFGLFPARRAARMNPTDSLRSDT